LKELGRAKPNGVVTYLGADKVSKFFFFLSLSLSYRDTGGALKTLKVIRAKCSILKKNCFYTPKPIGEL
jgi:hypothetical protein